MIQSQDPMVFHVLVEFIIVVAVVEDFEATLATSQSDGAFLPSGERYIENLRNCDALVDFSGMTLVFSSLHPHDTALFSYTIADSFPSPPAPVIDSCASTNRPHSFILS